MPNDGQLRIVDTGMPSAADKAGAPPKRAMISDAGFMPTPISKKWTKCNPFNGKRRSATHAGNVHKVDYTVGMGSGRKPHTPADKRIKRMLGQNIRRARVAIPMNEAPFAARLRVSASTLRKYEGGHSYPNPTAMHNLVFVLNIRPEFLFYGVEPIFEQPPAEHEA